MSELPHSSTHTEGSLMSDCEHSKPYFGVEQSDSHPEMFFDKRALITSLDMQHQSITTDGSGNGQVIAMSSCVEVSPTFFEPT